MDLQLEDRVMLVTGGTSGIGLATALRLAAEGAAVAVCGRDSARLEFAEAQLTAVSSKYLVTRADVTDQADLERLFGMVVDRWGRLDGLVNNAGTAQAQPFEMISEDDWESDLRLKLWAAIRTSKLAIPMLRRTAGAIVNVLSIYAKTPIKGSMPSSVSRAAGLSLSKGLSLDCAADNIRVNALLVGFITSGQWQRQAELAGESVADWQARTFGPMNIPLGRVGNAEEFADVAAFLLSPRSSYVTGAAINVDGGLCAVS